MGLIYYILGYNHSPLYISLRYNVHMVLSHANKFAVRLRVCVCMCVCVCVCVLYANRVYFIAGR